MHLQSLLCVTVSILSLGVLAAPAPPASGAQTFRPKGSSFGVPGVNASFDYVVVGGGTAGLTVATRLAEASFSVAVIEAGGFYEVDNGNLSVVPGYCTFYAGTDINDTQPLVDWSFVTQPQAGANNRRMHYARGKTLGGSSARNFMLYHRQTVGSAQAWANAVGDSSYTFNNLLPFYERSVAFSPPSNAYTNSSNVQDTSVFSNGGGPLKVSFGNYVDPFGTWVQPALQAIGQAAIKGFSAGKLIGSGYVPFTIDPETASRSSSETSFLQEAITDTQIQIYKNSLAQKILFDSTNTATGVSVFTEGTYGTPSVYYTLKATKEVIVSAGAFQSPQLLMVSGIGPRQTLEGVGVPVLKDLPGVGQNLWDQVYFGTAFRVEVPTASTSQNSPAANIAAINAYDNQAAGPLTIPAPGVLGWEKLPEPFRGTLSAATRTALDTNFPADWPELEYLPVSGAVGYNRNYQTEDPVDGFNYASITTALVAPLSRGNISISSASMADPPLINPNWLTDPADAELAVAAFKRQRQVWTHLSNITIGAEHIPGPQVQSNADILNFIRESLAQVWHAAATCKMGTVNDTMAVVDSSARVYGTKGLRVVDASSFPFLPPGHPQATIYALAEKIAAEIVGSKGAKKNPLRPSVGGASGGVGAGTATL